MDKKEFIQFLFSLKDVYSKTSGAYQVWLTWSNEMLKQGREIKESQTDWDSLPERDKELDAAIAADVIDDFLVWIDEHINGI